LFETATGQRFDDPAAILGAAALIGDRARFCWPLGASFFHQRALSGLPLSNASGFRRAQPASARRGRGRCDILHIVLAAVRRQHDRNADHAISMAPRTACFK
jgi:hypothetical protein